MIEQLHARDKTTTTNIGRLGRLGKIDVSSFDNKVHIHTETFNRIFVCFAPTDGKLLNDW